MAIFELFWSEYYYLNGTYIEIIRKDVGYLNYLFFSILSFLSLVSTSSNPIVFCYHYKLSTTSALLFTLLSVSDFITNIISPIIVSYNLLKSEIDELYKPATVIERVYTIFYTTVTGTSNVLVCLLSIMRYVSIRNSFYHIKIKFLVTYIIFYILLVFTATCYNFFSINTAIWVSNGQNVIATTPLTIILHLTIVVYFLLNFLISSITSFCTVYLLCRSKQSLGTSAANRSKGSVTIFIMNFMNFIYRPITLQWAILKRSCYLQHVIWI